jgi:hypothetical protein
VAIYAAGLSTYNFLNKRKEKQPQIRLGYGPGLVELGGLTETVIFLEASNTGSIPVRLPLTQTYKFCFQMDGTLSLGKIGKVT